MDIFHCPDIFATIMCFQAINIDRAKMCVFVLWILDKFYNTYRMNMSGSGKLFLSPKGQFMLQGLKKYPSLNELFPLSNYLILTDF